MIAKVKDLKAFSTTANEWVRWISGTMHRYHTCPWTETLLWIIRESQSAFHQATSHMRSRNLLPPKRENLMEWGKVERWALHFRIIETRVALHPLQMVWRRKYNRGRKHNRLNVLSFCKHISRVTRRALFRRALIHFLRSKFTTSKRNIRKTDVA